jgi:FemAB-related protein (PEP-CTERM system-associated)
MTQPTTTYSGSARAWNEFAARQQGFTHCHRYEWRGIIERTFGHECLYRVVHGPSGIEAVLPLVRVKSAIFGHYLMSMPFLNYGGPLGSTDGVRALVNDAVARADRDGAKLLELRSAVALPTELAVSHRKVTVVLPLSDSADATFAGFTSKLRSQIRRPKKEGVTVRFGASEVEPFFAVFSRHMRDLGTPTLPLSFFRAVADAFGEDAWFACAYLRGKPVAAGCGFVFNGEFELNWASSLRDFNREAPNMLVYWSLMERAIAAGLRRFNFGRCTPGSGTHRFKLQWGGVEEPLWWYGASRGTAATTPSPDAGAFSWGPRVWRNLPLPIATAIGPSIVRFIP